VCLAIHPQVAQPVIPLPPPPVAAAAPAPATATAPARENPHALYDTTRRAHDQRHDTTRPHTPHMHVLVHSHGVYRGQQLIEAAGRGDVEEVSRLLQLRADVTVVNRHGHTALMMYVGLLFFFHCTLIYVRTRHDIRHDIRHAPCCASVSADLWAGAKQSGGEESRRSAARAARSAASTSACALSFFQRQNTDNVVVSCRVVSCRVRTCVL
jgi:hypothetical protein